MKSKTNIMRRPFLKVLFSMLISSTLVVAQDGLLVHLKLNEAGGESAADSSGNSHDGKLVGVAVANSQWVDGKSDNAVSLGVGHVEITELPQMTSTTWAAWVRLDKDSAYGTAISAAFEGAGAGHTLGFHTGDNVRKPRVLWNHANGHISIMSEEPVELGEWYHMAVTYDADSEEIVLYVNGEPKANGTVGTTAFSTVNLGRRASSKNCPLNGALDDVAIFDRGLSSDEIGQLFDGEDIADGLVLSWGFEEEDGFACADSSGNGNDGSLVGYPAGEVSNWVDGKIGGALSLPQAAEHLEIAGLPSVTSTTWAAWVRLDADSAYGAAISAAFDGAGAGHSLGFHTGATVRHPRVLWNHANGHISLLSPDPVELGEWNHLAVTYNADSEDITLYVNGETKGSGKVGTTPFSVVHLGQRASSKNCSMNGSLDDLRIYNRALSADEISSLVASNAGPGLVAHWKFDEKSGLLAFDSGVNSNLGTLVDFEDDDSHWVDGKMGGAISFNGSNYIEVPHDPSIGADLVNGFSVSAWFSSNVELAASGSGNRMLEKGNSYFFLQGVGSGGMNFLVKKGGANKTATTGVTIDADEWNHIVGVFDGENAIVYLNGEQKGSVPVTAPVDDAGLPLRIGSDDSGNFFDGLMDEVMIWNKPLTEEEVSALFNNELNSDTETAPTITQDPGSMDTYEGGSITLSAKASGTPPMKYLWLKGDEPLRWATEKTLMIVDSKKVDSGSYKVRVSNSVGEVFSESANVTVLPVEGLETARQAFWKLNEQEGEVAVDSSKNENNADLIDFADDSSHWVEGKIGQGLELDGEMTYLSVVDDESLALGSEATFSFWIKPDSYGPNEDAGTYTRASSWILRKGDYFSLRLIDDPGTVRKSLLVRSDTGTIANTVNRKGNEVNTVQGSVEIDKWQHFTVVYKAGEIIFYKNGFRVGQPEQGVLGESNSDDLFIGSYDDDQETARYLDGMLDEVAIWSRPLAEAEILELAGRDISGAPLIVSSPRSQKKLEGTTVEFEVMVTGKRPVTYQWYHNGKVVQEATSNSLVLSKLSAEQAGDYTVQVTNEQGSITSDAAVLEIERLDAITSGLVAYYAFDESEGEALIDSSGNNINGTLENFDEGFGVPGRIGGAIAFDGDDDLISVPHNDLLNLANEATVSLWMNIEEFGSYDRVFRKAVNFDMVLLGGGVVRTHGVNKTPYSSPGDTWEVGTWQHYAFVYKGGKVQWFKNGEAIGPAISAKLGAVNSDPLIIGNFGPGLDIARLYDGLLDDMGIWQRGLSEVEISGIYQNGLAGKPLNEEFEPLNIRSISLDENNVDIQFYSPFSSRNYLVETKADISVLEWVEQGGVGLENLGNGDYKATFSSGQSANKFYRIVALEPPPLFFDDFEDGGEGWTHGGEGNNWELGVPTTGPNKAFSGSNVYGTGLGANFEPFTASYLRSPVIDLSEKKVQATLSFSEYRKVDPEISFHRVSVVVLDAETEETLDEPYEASGATNGWEAQAFRLKSDTLARKIIVEFRLSTDDFNLQEGWFLDDVKLVAE